MMATLHYAAFLAIVLVLQSYSATADSTDGSPCRENVCGKGKCVVSSNSTFGFECECEDGWTQTHSDDDDHFNFLPCVVPNCSLNSSCANPHPAPPPSHNQRRPNSSIFDQCSWIDCGGGSCSKTSVFAHTCTCYEGYYNLFNSTAFPCYSECEIGVDCQRLGIGLQNTSSSSPNRSSSPNPSLADNTNAANLIPRVESGWLFTMVTTLALVCL